ncbi:MAG: enolase C-terminal domain-like protein [Halobacteriaceae archaeon]
MEVTGFRFVERTGHLDVTGAELYEERLSRPVDRYPEFRDESAAAAYAPGDPDDPVEVTHVYLHVETDAGVEGFAGPVDRDVARLAAGFEDLLVGRDPTATAKLWDLMYRRAVHGRKGKTMQAISAVDVALWDLKGKAADRPIHRLLGGPVRGELPAYASMLGFSVDPEDVRERAAEYADAGYGAQKWFFRHGPGSGTEGKRRNEELVAAAREATGEEYDLMFDAWMSWDRAYALEMVERLAPYDPAWVEEPVMPDELDQYAEIREAAPFPVAGGEHEYTRWGATELLARDCVDVLQLDTFWGGGISEMRHVASLASVHDVPLIPHGHLVPANVQVIAAHPESVCPLVEYLVRWNETLQFFFADPVEPEGGTVTVPDGPGLGVEIDDSTVEAERELDL